VRAFAVRLGLEVDPSGQVQQLGLDDDLPVDLDRHITFRH
jgi:hypothetical protein